MNQLTTYIKENTDRGVTREDIIVALQQSGWGEADIKNAFTIFDNQNLPPQNAENYTVLDSFKETWLAFKHNQTVFLQATSLYIVSLVVLGVVSIAIFGTLHGYMESSYGTAYNELSNLLQTYQFYIGVLLLILAGLTTILYINVIIFAFKDAAENTITKLRQLIDTALKYIGRMTATLLQVCLIVLWPLLLLLPILFAVLSSGEAAQQSHVVLVIIGFFIAAGLIMLLSLASVLFFSLAPYVALFEPEVKIRHILKRSAQLSDGSVKLLVLLAVIITSVVSGFISFAATVPISILLPVASNIASIVLTIIIYVVQYGVLYMIYRNRIARLNTQPSNNIALNS